MICADARAAFSALVDEGLTPGERVGLAAHLDGCSECRRELERFRRTVELLRRIEPARAPAGFADRVLAAARPMPWRRRLFMRLFVPLPVKIPVEAAAVVLIAGAALYLYPRSPELQQATRQEAPLSAPLASAPSSASPFAVPAPPPRPAPSARSSAAKALPPALEKPIPRPPRAPEAGGGVAGVSPEGPPAATRENQAPPAALPLAKTAPGAGAPAPPAERRKDASEGASKETAATTPETAESRALLQDQLTPAVSGRLAVSDREAAARALAELVARLGGTALTRRVGPEGLVVLLVVPRRAYPELVIGLGRLGAWRPEREPTELPPAVHIEVRVTD